MSDLCYKGVTVPTPTTEECDGNYISTNCVATPNAITYLSLLSGAKQTAINGALVAALMGKDQLISDLQSQIDELTLRVTALEL